MKLPPRSFSAAFATTLCVVGGMLTDHHFPWNLIPIILGGILVGLLAYREDER